MFVMNYKRVSLVKSLSFGAIVFLLQNYTSFAQLSEADNLENARLNMILVQVNSKIAIDPKLPDVLSAKVSASQLIFLGNNKELEEKWKKQKEEITKNLDALEKALQPK